MANVNGTMNSDIILMEVIPYARVKKPSLKVSTLDWSSTPAHKGQTIISRNLGDLEVEDFNGATTDTSTVDVSLTLTEFKQIGVSFTADEINSTSRQLIKEQAEPMSEKLGNYLVSLRSNLYTVANFSENAEVVEPIDNCQLSTITKLRRILTEQGAPGKINIEVNSEVYEQLILDVAIQNAAQKDSGDNAVVDEAVIRNVAGCDIYENPRLPTDENLIGFASVPAATVLAVRPIKHPKEILPDAPATFSFKQIVSEGGFGITKLGYIKNDLSATEKLAWLAGSTVGNAKYGVRLVKAANV